MEKRRSLIPELLILTTLCGCHAINIYVLYQCIYKDMDYYYGSLLFTPIFIVSFWISNIFIFVSKRHKAMTSNSINKVITINDVISMIIITAWIYIYLKYNETTAYAISRLEDLL